MSKDKFCNLDEMRPTQVTVGVQEVEAKEWEILNIEKGHVKEWLAKHPIPAVLSPDGKMYLIDHHHLGLALCRLSERYSYEHPHAKKGDNPYSECCFTIVKDFSNTELTHDEFFKCMESINMLHPYDENCKKVDPSKIPRHIADLKDDPYRSLAGFVRKAGGYQKSNAPFTEFKWADYFRDQIPEELIKNDIQGAIAKANILIKTDIVCKSLPGYVENAECKELSHENLGLATLDKKKVEKNISDIKIKNVVVDKGNKLKP